MKCIADNYLWWLYEAPPGDFFPRSLLRNKHCLHHKFEKLFFVTCVNSQPLFILKERLS